MQTKTNNEEKLTSKYETVNSYHDKSVFARDFLRARKIKPAVAYCCMDLVVCQRAENSQKLCEIYQYTRRHNNHVEG